MRTDGQFGVDPWWGSACDEIQRRSSCRFVSLELIFCEPKNQEECWTLMGNDRKDGTKTSKVLGLNREERALFVAWQSGRVAEHNCIDSLDPSE